MKYSSLLGSIPRMVPSALLDLPSLPTLIFSVYMFTLLLTVLEKTVIKKIETVTLTSLTKMKSVDVFDEKIIRSTHFRL